MGTKDSQCHIAENKFAIHETNTLCFGYQLASQTMTSRSASRAFSLSLIYFRL